MEILKLIIFILATAIMEGIVIISPEVSQDVAIFYVSILSSYLGLDIWAMIQKTASLPSGEYKDINIHRYLISAGSYVVLLATAFYMKAKFGYDYGTMYSTFIAALFLMATILIGGLEGNKIATNYEKKDEKPSGETL